MEDLHGLVGAAAPAPKASAILAEGWDEADVALYGDSFFRQHLHGLIRSKGVVHIGTPTHGIKGMRHDLFI